MRRLLMIQSGVRAASQLAREVAASLRDEPREEICNRVGDLGVDLHRYRVVMFSTQWPHGQVPFPYFTKALVALDLPRRDVVEPWELPTPHNPEQVVVGQTVQGRLLPPDTTEGDVRRFRDYALDLAAGRCVLVTLRGGPAPWQPWGLDPRLQLFVRGERVVDDDDGVGADDPGHERFDSRARWCAERRSTVVIRASARTGSWHGGSFTLTVREAAPLSR